MLSSVCHVTDGVGTLSTGGNSKMIEWPAFTRSFCGGVDLKDDISENLNVEIIFDPSILLKFIRLLDNSQSFISYILSSIKPFFKITNFRQELNNAGCQTFTLKAE